ncbi:MAG: serine/threonine protein kinase, partial [Myxococcales bacterium]|nr:serine/threonine protein kinase [Myxococcales bacterium]
MIGGKYRIEAKLGQGGFGVVLRARHVQREHDFGAVVLKFLQSSVASTAAARRRFINEARAARALSSAHVVKVFDFDFDEDGAPYIVMEYLEGRSLREVLHREAPLDAARALRIGAQIANALEECHAAGIVHRDLKPANVVVTRRSGAIDFAKVVDFGIAQLPDTSLSLSLLGTPKYMAPEHIEQQAISGAVDVFALGVMLFECLTGEPPIAADQSMKYLRANVEVAPRRLRQLRPELPQALDNLLDAMMAKDPQSRPSSARLSARLDALASEIEDAGLSPAASRGTLASQPTESLVAPAELPSAPHIGEPPASAGAVLVLRPRHALLAATVVLVTLATVVAAAAAWLDDAPRPGPARRGAAAVPRREPPRRDLRSPVRANAPRRA